MYGLFHVRNTKVVDLRIQIKFSGVCVGGGGGGDAASSQGWSHKFYHCKNQYLRKPMGVLVPLYPPSGSAHGIQVHVRIV